MNEHRGIILKHITQNSFSVLDEKNGKIPAFVASEKMSRAGLKPGMVITYELHLLSQNIMLKTVRIQALPFFFARHDIFFLHHILELCYYFLPIGSTIEPVFILLLECIEIDRNIWQTLHKKIFMWKFFALLGMYPENKSLERDFFYCLTQKSIIEIFEMKIDDKMIKIFDTWLWQCIISHPHHACFKTIDFLRNNGAL